MLPKCFHGVALRYCKNVALPMLLNILSYLLTQACSHRQQLPSASVKDVGKGNGKVVPALN
jgi:hypothetical protein